LAAMGVFMESCNILKDVVLDNPNEWVKCMFRLYEAIVHTIKIGKRDIKLSVFGIVLILFNIDFALL
jgi:hypothetical protein